jgi:cell filamentation protein
MALRAGLPPLDFGGLKSEKIQEHFGAIRAGLYRDYKPMEEIFSGVILRTLRRDRKQ